MELLSVFPGRDDTVYRFLVQHLDTMVAHTAEAWANEMQNSDPIQGMNVLSELRSLNTQFLRDRVKLIRQYVIDQGAGETPPDYVLTDGLKTSRSSVQQYQRPANQILNDWYFNSGRPMEAREDTQGDTYSADSSRTFMYGGGDGMYTGVRVCDQSELNTSQHVQRLYGDPYVHMLNGPTYTQDGRDNVNFTGGSSRGAPKLWGGQFGDGSDENNRRLLATRTFRSNEAGEENGIPRYEQRLYKRFLERDVSEAMPGVERGTAVYGYDMASLHNRVNQRQAFNMAHMKQYS